MALHRSSKVMNGSLILSQHQQRSLQAVFDHLKFIASASTLERSSSFVILSSFARELLSLSPLKSKFNLLSKESAAPASLLLEKEVFCPSSEMSPRSVQRYSRKLVNSPVPQSASLRGFKAQDGRDGKTVVAVAAEKMAAVLRLPNQVRLEKSFTEDEHFSFSESMDELITEVSS